MKLVSQAKSFGGMVQKFSHKSSVVKTEMNISVFLPSLASSKRVPALYFLSGLTCNEDNFIQKAGALRFAEEKGIALICPDTSPRGLDIEGEHDSWDFGSGAGFYVDATTDLWKDNYNMFSYVNEELPSLVQGELPVSEAASIFGHSMGGHGALISYLKNPNLWKSCSAFAPIVNPTQCPWGRKCFGHYLGSDSEAWKEYDATCLVSGFKGDRAKPILIDTGDADSFLEEQLKPENFASACAKAGQTLENRTQAGYDHSYWFISTFIRDHINHHAKYLLQH